LEARDRAPGAFAFERFLAAAHAFPEESGIPWTVLTVVPAEELYGAATQEVRRTAFITALLLLVALVLGTVFSQHLARSVIQVEAEMDRIARFDLSAVALADHPSVFREINAMGDAHDRMKQGLRSFGRYVPRQLVEQLMQGGDEARVGGEVREVTVLFCDIADFTTLVEATPPERLVSALSEYMTHMNRLIVEEQGSVAQYLGDAIVAVWGAPQKVDDHALCATRAAVRMCALLDALVQEAAEKGFPEFHTRIGVYTGPCIVGNIGAQERFNYTILGEARTQAERLEGLNKRFGTTLLIGKITAERVGGTFKIRRIEEVQPVGGGARFSVYEVLGEADA
jgi:adenylate cyclase